MVRTLSGSEDCGSSTSTTKASRGHLMEYGYWSARRRACCGAPRLKWGIRRASTSAHCAAKVWSLQGRGSRRSSPARRGRDGAGAGRQQPGQQRSPIVVMEPPQLGRFGRRCDGSRPHPGGRLGERPGGVFTSSLSTVLKTACPTMGSCRMWRRRKNSPAGSPLERALNLDRSPNVTNPAS